MKKILINAISIKEGGGVVVLTKLLEEMCCIEKNIHWIIIIDESIRYKIKANERITMLAFSWVKKSILHFLFWHEFYLPLLVKRLKVDCFFSQTNILPLFNLKCSSLLLVHQAGYFSKEYVMLNAKFNKSWKNQLSWKIRCLWTKYTLKKATFVTVQTKALADNIVSQVKINRKKLIVIPHGSGIAMGEVIQKKFPDQKIWRIGYITKYGVQKNFEVLFRAISELKNQSFNFKLILTLDENHVPFQYVKKLIEKYNISELIENYGEIPHGKIQQIYPTIDIFLFPSLCESFGFTLVEAMYYGLPIIAADTESNCELLGLQGEFFTANDSFDLLRKIKIFMQNKNRYDNASIHSYERSALYSWKTAANNFLNLFKEMSI